MLQEQHYEIHQIGHINLVMCHFKFVKQCQTLVGNIIQMMLRLFNSHNSNDFA
jgi:hypothetical protein